MIVEELITYICEHDMCGVYLDYGVAAQIELSRVAFLNDLEKWELDAVLKNVQIDEDGDVLVELWMNHA